jgi:phosphopantetheine adenylyltransferase
MVTKNVDGTIVFMKKDGTSINFIDRTMMVFYEKAIEHFQELGLDTIITMPDNWVFGFQYFPSLAPVNIAYDRLPKNNLVLTDIQITNGQGRVLKTISDPRVLSDWSKTLDVERPPIIYNGNLTSIQKDKIMDYLSTPESDLMSMFKSQSFTRYIISVLNPDLRTSALMNDIDKPIEGIVFKFITPGESEVYSARLIDPVIQQHSKSITKPVDRKANDMYQIAMLDIIEFMELVDMEGIQLNSESPDERYIELVSVLFNDYIQKNGHKYIGVDFETPDFAKKPEFEINLATIPNERTKEILKNSKLNDLFKIIISSFRRYRKNTTPILTQQIVDTLNGIIEKIQKKVEIVPEENQILDFNNYLKRSQIENVASVFESIINEALKLNTTEQGSKKVNIFAGRFQPFTEGHMKVVEQLYKENGLPTFILIVRGGKADPTKNPFDEDTQLAMIGAIQSNMIEGAAVINTAGIDTIYNAVRPAYEPVLWGAGTDRLKAYKYQIDKYKEELNAVPELDAFEIKRSDEDISATKVREALKIDDEATFKRMTPKGMHKMYDQLKTIMQEVKENFGYKLLTFNDFITESVKINEAKEGTLWDIAYDSWAESAGVRADRVVAGTKGRGKPSKGEGEVLRASFGGTSVAEQNITSYLNSIGAPEGTYVFDAILPPKQGNSGDYYTYIIKFKKQVTLLNKFSYTRGGTIEIVDATKESKSGDIAVIGKKKLTPDAMGLSTGSYKSSKVYESAIKSGIDTTEYPDNYKDFLKGLVETITKSGSHSNSYTDMLDFLKNGTGTSYEYKFDKGLAEGIDLISISNIANDFGEVLGGLHLFNIIKSYDSGVSFPTASNAELVDFIFDSMHISSKAGSKGGTPAATGLVKAVTTLKDSGELTMTSEEQDLYDNILKKIVDLSIFDFYNEMLSSHLSGAGTPYNYLISTSGLESTTLTKDVIIEWLYKLHENKSKFISFYKELWNLCGTKPKDMTADDIYKNWDSIKDETVFGAVFYPLVTTVVDYLNNLYQKPLTSLVNKSQDLAQIYLIFDIKGNSMSFVSKSFSVAEFKFEAKGSVPNPFNAKIGITSGSVKKK